MDSVLILMSTYNGERYLEEQINSLLNQRDVDIQILVRDDGSTDKTTDILNDYQKKGLLKWYTGDNLRPAKSFMDLVYHAPDYEYYAFCDQDDYWEEDKLNIALEWLKKQTQEVPALYYGRPRLVDQNLSEIHNPETTLHRMLTFREAIINSNATGCTMVFNAALMKKVQEKRPNYIAMHDGWFHKVCLISGGKVYFDEDVHILYRQHGKNVIGIDGSMLGKLKKHIRSLKNKECIRSRTISSLLDCYGDQMNREDYELSEMVAYYRHDFKKKLKLLTDKRIRTSYKKRNLLFKIAVLFNAY